MKLLSGKKIILAVTGSIAAYKSALLIRLLIKAGAEVKVIMTPSAEAFISPLTLSTLSKQPVLSTLINAEHWNNHVEMGLWADAMVVAPATANTISHFAHGICQTLVDAVYLSARCPVFLAPAMDVDMWHHSAVQQNIEQLISFGNHIIPVGVGELASGLSGEGRMAEPSDILSFLVSFWGSDLPLKGKKCLITAGPTHEPIDPVRYIGNRSTGKMGLCIAEEAARLGAEVDLILGPTHLAPSPHITVHRVQTAKEMLTATASLYAHTDIAIFAAAVADYGVATIANQKVKKSENLTLELIQNPDIALAMGHQKKQHQINVGFALETENGAAYATAKLEKKNFDFIVLNSLQHEGAGFGHDTNRVTFYFPDGQTADFPLKPKAEVATDILNAVLKVSAEKNLA